MALKIPSWPGQITHYPGSSGYVTGEKFPSADPIRWDEVLRRTVSSAPGFKSYYDPGMGAARTVRGVPVTSWSAGAGAIPTDVVPQVTGAGGASAGPSSFGPNANPFFTLSNVKSPGIDTRVNALLGDFDKLRTVGIGDFTTRYNETTPQFRSALNEDIGASSAFFDGQAANELAALRETRKVATRAAADRALGDLSRILGIGRMGEGSGTSTGPSSFLTKLGLDNASRIETQTALDDSTQARSDFDTVNATRLGLLGKRGDLLNTDVQRTLQPSQVSASWFNNLLAQLGLLNQNTGANTFFGLGKEYGTGSIPAYPGYA